jgi:hypothetical protein
MKTIQIFTALAFILKTSKMVWQTAKRLIKLNTFMYLRILESILSLNFSHGISHIITSLQSSYNAQMICNSEKINISVLFKSQLWVTSYHNV